MTSYVIHYHNYHRRNAQYNINIMRTDGHSYTQSCYTVYTYIMLNFINHNKSFKFYKCLHGVCIHL